MSRDRSNAEGAPLSLRAIGPGLIIAATGVGAGDLVTAAVAGSRYGYAVVWAAAVGALLKFGLNEGLARWQLATGTTLLEGWTRHLGRWVQYAFLAYLVVWSFVVGGALIAACGIAAHALAPQLPYTVWGALHSVAAATLVVLGRYASFERLMRWFIGLMFVTLVGCALVVRSPLHSLSAAVGQAAVPPGGVAYVLGVIGGVGGSVTLLSYGYWMRERGWVGPARLTTVRLDLAVAYALTGIFGVAVVVLAANVLHGRGVTIEGAAGAVTMAQLLGEVLGPVGRWTFLVGFWGAVATSMLGVWQGVPYLFCDFVGLLRGLDREQRERLLDTRSWWYRGYLLWLALPPLALLYTDSPVTLVVVYSITGALFMPFLAATLLYLNGGRRIGARLRNGLAIQLLLLVSLALFGFLAYERSSELFWGGP